MEKLCELNAIAEDSSKSFQLRETPIFVVRQDGNYHAYVNWCPHLRVPLNYEPDLFLNCDSTYIMCANHGALFDISSGQCLAGPCTGKYLLPVPCEPRSDGLYVGTPPQLQH